MKTRIIKSRIALIVLGVGLGFLARMVLGVPAQEMVPKRTIERPIKESAEVPIDLPLDNRDESIYERHESENIPSEGDVSGLVLPISIPGNSPFFTVANDRRIQETTRTNRLLVPKFLDNEFSHDSDALFEPHGEQVCASGCAASRHPTEKLSRADYLRLLAEVKIEPMNRTNNALEELMYYGPQTRKWIESDGIGTLDQERASFIWDELEYTHAKIAIRIIDEAGNVRIWLDETKIPFDRRHVFDMKTADVQPLVMSGTAKRVGLDHIWVRL